MHLPRRALISATATVTALLMAGCGSGGSGKDTDAKTTDRSADIQAALKKGGSLTLWTWSTKFGGAVKAFEQAYPNVHVKLVNAGQSAEEYTALQNAITAKKNIPDVAMVEYFALPQLALSKQLEPVNKWGLDKLQNQFTASSWKQMSFNGATYGLPNNTGPLVMIYNTAVFKKAGITEPPATWDEYAADAKKINAADSQAHIASIDPGDAGGVDSLIWQGGGRPFSRSGNDVTVNFGDAGTTKVAGFWSDLLSRHLVAAQPGWTDEWWRAVGAGKIATWVTGAWGLGNVASTLTDKAGTFRVAPAPVWNAADPQNAENGGSGFSVVRGGQNTALAMGFLQWFSTEKASLAPQIKAGSFPAQVATLKDPAYLNEKLDYYGGQQAHQILAQASERVADGWQYLPFQVYANSVFRDSVGSAISAGKPIRPSLDQWGAKLKSYGSDQGFKVS